MVGPAGMGRAYSHDMGKGTVKKIKLLYLRRQSPMEKGTPTYRYLGV